MYVFKGVANKFANKLLNILFGNRHSEKSLELPVYYIVAMIYLI